MDKKIIALIVAPSGSGKTAICEKLFEKYGLKQVVSYTTRNQRSSDDHSHIFINENEMHDQKDMCAYTHYHGEHYYATHQQIEESDLYVVDPAGVKYFFQKYRGSKTPRLIYIDVPIKERLRRMHRRGDSMWEVMQRCEMDKRIFADITYDIAVVNDDLEACADEIYEYIQMQTKLINTNSEVVA